MESDSFKIPETIPAEFVDNISASTAFYKLVSVFERLEGKGKMSVYY